PRKRAHDPRRGGVPSAARPSAREAFIRSGQREGGCDECRHHPRLNRQPSISRLGSARKPLYGRGMAGSPSFPPTGGDFPFAELAQGGMGRTLIAARPETLPPSVVVIKRPHAHLLTDPSVHQRFHHEAAIASAV